MESAREFKARIHQTRIDQSKHNSLAYKKKLAWKARHPNESYNKHLKEALHEGTDIST